jgi:hypothetical protein
MSSKQLEKRIYRLPNADKHDHKSWTPGRDILNVPIENVHTVSVLWTLDVLIKLFEIKLNCYLKCLNYEKNIFNSSILPIS